MVLECKNLIKRFGGVTAVNGVSKSFEHGTIHGLIGPNGAGKTTFFNMLTGFLRPDDGGVWIDNQNMTGVSAHKCAAAGVSRTFQDTRVFPGLTLLDNLYAAAEFDTWTLLGQRPNTEIKERAHDMLELIEMEDMKNKQANDLSYGQKKLLDFATVLMTEPEYVLLDEPVAGVNPSLITNIKDFVVTITDETTPIIVEHNMDFAMNVCEELNVMHQGQIIATGTTEEVQKDQTVRDAYLGGV